MSKCYMLVNADDPFHATKILIYKYHTHTHTCTYTLTKIPHIPHCSGLQQSIGLNTPL